MFMFNQIMNDKICTHFGVIFSRSMSQLSAIVEFGIFILDETKHVKPYIPLYFKKKFIKNIPLTYRKFQDKLHLPRVKSQLHAKFHVSSFYGLAGSRGQTPPSPEIYI
jgi:hypothetical protein